MEQIISKVINHVKQVSKKNSPDSIIQRINEISDVTNNKQEAT